MPVGLCEGWFRHQQHQQPPKKIEQVKEKSPHISTILVGFDFSFLFGGFYLLVLGLCQGLIFFHLKQRQFLHGGHETIQWIKLYPPSHRFGLFYCRSKSSIFDTMFSGVGWWLLPIWIIWCSFNHLPIRLGWPHGYGCVAKAPIFVTICIGNLWW